MLRAAASSRRTSPSCGRRCRRQENRRWTSCMPPLRRGVLVHRSSVGRLLHRLGLSHKKNHYRPASRNAPPFVRRARCG
ncbi:winged helix-turn-helix domain-containing protein [Aminobacter sp. J15]|uniref:winged helix-turn-helix domain-containing protein n=1 Tax=Aminobacter sp. J15 TaxID=935260 RepID=UPI0032B25894